MNTEEIRFGESRNIEFKAKLPEKSEKYIKTVVAFANTAGGKIIFGVDDTGTVTGISADCVFSTMDAITNAISDSCEPPIIPDISLQTIDDKTVIIVEISAGAQRPFFIKSLGRDRGVYIRVAGTTRPADEYMIKELLFEGSNRCFDQTICLNKNISKPEIEALCHRLKECAVRNSANSTNPDEIKEVTIRQLLSWGILAEKNGEYLPTNAYSILTGDWSTSIQCGVFKGTTKAVFIDRREFAGALQNQIEEAYQFVLRNIHLGATFNGLYRQDEYEIPTDVIRELIINAVVHRSYLDSSNIQVAIYDDRLEVTSPGKLPMGQTLERMKEGYSKIRNEALANAFSYMRLIEHWGSGIPRIFEKLKEAGLRPPEFIGGDTDLRINIYRGQIEVTDPKTDLKPIQSDLETGLIKLIKSNPELTLQAYGDRLGVSASTIKRMIHKMQLDGILVREGSNRKSKLILK